MAKGWSWIVRSMLATVACAALSLLLIAPAHAQYPEPQEFRFEGPYLLPPLPPEDQLPVAPAPTPPADATPTAAPTWPPPGTAPAAYPAAPYAPTQFPPATYPVYQPQPNPQPLPSPAPLPAQPAAPAIPPAPPSAEIVPPPSNPNALPPVVVDDPGVTLWGQKVWDPEILDPWEGNVELGMNGTDGNSETFNIRLGVTAKHKTEFLVKSLQFTTIQKSANGNVTANTALLDGRLDWPMPNTRFNYFIHGLAEYDEFKAFDVRLSGDTGFGYEFIQNDVTTLIGRSGLAFSQEIGGPDTTIHPELLFGGEYKHKFNPTHSVSAKIDYYPDVTEWSDFRLNSQISWEIALKQAWGLSLKLSVIDRYDSTPQGAKPNDVDYSTLLLWTF